MFIQIEKIGSAAARGNGSNAPAAPYTNAAHSFSSLPSALPLGATRLHGTRGKADHASFHASSALLKRGKVAQALIDVCASLLVSLFVLLYLVVILGLIPLSIFVLLFVQL